MRYLVVYDISDDKLRARIAEKLKDYGLRRIQYSAFLGELIPRRLRSLVQDLRRIIGSKPMENERRIVHVFPVPSSLSGVIVIGDEWKEEEKGVEVF